MLAVLAVAPYLLQLHNPARVPVSDAPSSDNGQLARIIDVETTTTPPIRHSFDQFIFTCLDLVLKKEAESYVYASHTIVRFPRLSPTERTLLAPRDHASY